MAERLLSVDSSRSNLLHHLFQVLCQFLSVNRLDTSRPGCSLVGLEFGEGMRNLPDVLEVIAFSFPK